MSNKDLGIAVSTVWVVIAAVLVMFMQAGFAFLEAGLTRMKNVGHIAAKNVLILAIASIVYYLVGFGIAFGDGGNGFWGGSGFLPSINELLDGRHRRRSRGSARSRLRPATCSRSCSAGVSLAIVWGAMAERTKLWVYFAFGAIFTLIYSLVSHWIWSPDGWLFERGMQDFAGSTVVHYQGALAGLAGALLLGPRIGKYGKDGKSNAIPGHNMAYTTLGVIILWFGWFGFNPGSTLGVDFGGVGFFAYVALNTNLAAAAGVLGAVVTSWIVIKKPDLSMMLNGAIAALVAITAACAFVAPWAAILIGFVAGVIVVARRPRRRPDRDRRSRRRDRRARHVRRVGHARARVPDRAEPGREARDGLGRALLRRRAAPARRRRPSASRPSARSRSRVSFAILFLFKITFGIRTEAEVEEAGLDVSEHGMWGYPEFYIPVPGGYGTETHSHLGGAAAARATAPPAAAPSSVCGRGAQLDPSRCGGAAPSAAPPAIRRPATSRRRRRAAGSRSRPSPTFVSRPSSSRTSVPSMKTLRNCGSSSPSSKMRSRSGG